MVYGTVRISDSAHAALRGMSKAERKPMLALLDEAVEILRRQRFLEQVNTAYEGLRQNARTWEAVERERRAWDGTLADGLTVAEGHAPHPTRRPRKKKRKRS